jgi:PAS domain S-box-containing protein
MRRRRGRRSPQDPCTRECQRGEAHNPTERAEHEKVAHRHSKRTRGVMVNPGYSAGAGDGEVGENDHVQDFEYIFGGSGNDTLMGADGHEERFKGNDGHDLILIAISDVTEARGAEMAIRASENRYRRLFEAANEGVLILDPNTHRIVDANPFLCDMLGYPHAELVGKEMHEIGLLQDQPASRLALQQLREKRTLRYDNMPLKTKQGEPRNEVPDQTDEPVALTERLELW